MAAEIHLAKFAPVRVCRWSVIPYVAPSPRATVAIHLSVCCSPLPLSADLVTPTPSPLAVLVQNIWEGAYGTPQGLYLSPGEACSACYGPYTPSAASCVDCVTKWLASGKDISFGGCAQCALTPGGLDSYYLGFINGPQQVRETMACLSLFTCFHDLKPHLHGGHITNTISNHTQQPAP